VFLYESQTAVTIRLGLRLSRLHTNLGSRLLWWNPPSKSLFCANDYYPYQIWGNEAHIREACFMES